MKRSAKKKVNKFCYFRKSYRMLIIMLIIVLILLLILLFVSYRFVNPQKNEKGLNSLGTEESISVGNINSVCGNGICENGENDNNCPADCGCPVCNNDGTCDGIENNENCPNDCMEEPISPEFKNIINNTWENNKQWLVDNDIDMDLGDYANPVGLYDIEGYTINLLKYAEYTKDYGKIDELSSVYLNAYKYLNDSNGYKTWICGQGLIGNCTNGTAYETNLDNSQFDYAITSELEAIASINPENRTENMNEFAENYTNVTLNFLMYTEINYSRQCKNYWGWLSQPVYDQDFWVAADSAEILMANNEDPSLVPISDSNKSSLLGYINCTTFYLQKRLNESNLTDFNGNPVNGLLLDSGLQCGGEYNGEFLFSNYTGSTFPDETDKSCSPTVGWDISHGMRFVPFFETLYNARNVTNQNFPDDNTMNELVNQIAYGVFNKNFTSPLFTNFLDGSNGWYGVNDTIGNGNGPYGISIAIPTGGYGSLSEYNSDLYKIMNSLWLMFDTPDKDSLTTQLLQNYYMSNPQYWNYTQTIYSIDSIKSSLNQSNSLILLEFLPSLVSSKYCGNGICESSIDENCSTCPIDCGQCPCVNCNNENNNIGGNSGGNIKFKNTTNTTTTLSNHENIINESQNNQNNNTSDNPEEIEKPENIPGFNFINFIKIYLIYEIFILFIAILIILILIIILIKKNDHQRLFLVIKRMNEFRNLGYHNWEIRKLFVEKGWDEKLIEKLMKKY